MGANRAKLQRAWYLRFGLLLGAMVAVLYHVKYGAVLPSRESALAAAAGTMAFGVLVGWLLWWWESRTDRG